MRYTVYAPISLWLDSLPEITSFEVSNLRFPPLFSIGPLRLDELGARRL